MGHLLNSGEVGNIGLEHLKQIRSKTIGKWDSLGFLDGLKGHVKENIAQLYENQASSLLNEATDANSSGSFETVVFPIVRRVFSKLLANDIVSVQAMNMPIGKLFYFVPKTSGRNHAPLNGPALPGQECVFSACAGTQQSEFLEKSLYDVFYNDGMFDASKGTATQVPYSTTNPVIVSANGQTVATAYADQPVAADGSIRSLTMCVTGFTSTGAGRLTGPDGNEMDTESFLSSLTVIADDNVENPAGDIVIAAGESIPFTLTAQKYGRGIVDYGDICTPDGCLMITVDLTSPNCVDCNGSSFDGYIGAKNGTETTDLNFSAAWMRYESLEFATEMGEVSFELDEVVVSVTERKLRATWSPELAQDVSAFHNIDAEAELTALLSEQVAAEIDREILRDLRTGSAWSLRWDYNGWKRAAAGGGFNAYTQKEWNQTLITKINQLSAQIHKSTLRGGANFIVVSSEASAIFDDLEYFHVSNAAPEQDQYNMGIEKVGSLGGRYTVYRDPYAPANSIIVGHKGKSLLDTGYIYAPYVPLQLTPTLQNPFNFAPTKGIMTRYAKKMVNNRFYGTVTIDGVVTFDTNLLR
tara:strand:+ start:628 stop:2376 length:1749 start_codon:yes stop_codon:yes gene_type:complete